MGRNIARRVEISDGKDFVKSFPSHTQAAKECGISAPSVLKYALDHGKTQIVRRSDRKVFYVREVGRWAEGPSGGAASAFAARDPGVGRAEV